MTARADVALMTVLAALVAAYAVAEWVVVPGPFAPLDPVFEGRRRGPARP